MRKTEKIPLTHTTTPQTVIYNLSLPTATADALTSGRPNKISRDIVEAGYRLRAAHDPSLHDALDRAGFAVDRSTPLMDNIFSRFGGYYIDVGASAHIVRGEIKVKSGVLVKQYVEEGVEFEDGSVVRAQVVVTAVGQEHDYRVAVGGIVGGEVAGRLGDFWGLDEEGEVKGVMKPAGMLSFREPVFFHWCCAL